jgi:hypothetical protein
MEFAEGGEAALRKCGVAAFDVVISDMLSRLCALSRVAGFYGVSFPDSLGSITAGKTLDEAARMACSRWFPHLGHDRGGGNSAQVDIYRCGPGQTRGHRLAGERRPSNATVRLSITGRESHMVKIDALAAAAGLARAGYKVRAALGAHIDENKQAAARQSRGARAD